MKIELITSGAQRLNWFIHQR